VQTAYLESHLPEFLAKQPNLATFWPTVERGYFALWPEEPNLGLPIADRSIEDSGLTDAEQKLLGDTETKTTGVCFLFLRRPHDKFLMNNPLDDSQLV
jgi:hypothetical protein